MSNAPHSPSGPFSDADLVITPKGTIYHLDLKPDQIAENIIIVGDPHRVSTIAREQALHHIEFEHEHRGLRTITGQLPGSNLRVSIVTSGMGTSSLEIVLAELLALSEIDFSTRCRKIKFPSLKIIRVGTSGALQSETNLGTPIITSYSVGLDNTGLFFASVETEKLRKLEELVDRSINEATPRGSRFKGRIHAYSGCSSPEVITALQAAAKEFGIHTETGITFSNAGFHAPQGRDFQRLNLTVPDIDRVLAKIEFDGFKALNMEMETSYLNHFGHGHGYLTGAICSAVANRALNTFEAPGGVGVYNSARIAMRALEILG